MFSKMSACTPKSGNNQSAGGMEATGCHEAAAEDRLHTRGASSDRPASLPFPVLFGPSLRPSSPPFSVSASFGSHTPAPLHSVSFYFVSQKSSEREGPENGWSFYVALVLERDTFGGAARPRPFCCCQGRGHGPRRCPAASES